MRNSNEISFEIVKRIGIIERHPSGWSKEVNPTKNNVLRTVVTHV